MQSSSQRPPHLYTGSGGSDRLTSLFSHTGKPKNIFIVPENNRAKANDFLLKSVRSCRNCEAEATEATTFLWKFFHEDFVRGHTRATSTAAEFLRATGRTLSAY